LKRRGNGLPRKIQLLKKEAATAVWATMKVKTKIGLENEEEKANEKTNTTGGKTWWYLIFFRCWESSAH